uniref:Uncharacterized protein n=1 Tax=Arundo donax TaxID=35708 RepID=A0A0A8YM39_ARUDO
MNSYSEIPTLDRKFRPVRTSGSIPDHGDGLCLVNLTQMFWVGDRNF